MKKYNAIISVLCVVSLLASCSEDGGLSSGGGQGNDVGMVMINTVDETENADWMLLCDDGSYIMACMNDGNGHGVIRMELNAGGEDTQGYTILVDADGIPVAVGNDEMTIQIGNITDTDFDCAVIEKGSDDIHYYWDIPYTFDGVATRGLVGDVWNSVASPFKSWYDQVSGGIRNFTWDEHSRKMILPYTLKVCGFWIQALSFVENPIKGVPSMLNTIIDEGYKSGLWDQQTPWWCDTSVMALDFLKENGKWGLKFDLAGGSISLAADLMITAADAMYDELSRCEPATSAVFTGEEWQIKLSPATIEAGPEAAIYTASVTSQALWEVEGGASWCRARKEGDNVVVEVDDYSGRETRNCTVVVKTVTYTSDIPNALLHVVQQGVLFDLSESSLTFEAKGGSAGVYVNTNEQITSWSVSGCPSWVRISGKSDNSFYINVEENNEGEDRSGTITVTGITTSGSMIDRTVQVTQYGDLDWQWDNTSWSFSGMCTSVMDGENITDVMNFDMYITSVNDGQISIYGDFGAPQLSSTVDATGQLVIRANYNETLNFEDGWIKIQGMLTFIFKRTGVATSECRLSGSIDLEYKEDAYYDRSTATYDGSLSGTLKNEKNEQSVRSQIQEIPMFLKQFVR